MPHTDQGIPGEEKAWKEHPVLSFDGGGVRGYASLLILRALMEAIKKHETSHEEQPYKSSFQPTYQPKRGPADQSVVEGPSHSADSIPRTPSWRPLSDPTERGDQKTSETRLYEPEVFLPCHYFDYIVGTSTGGLNAIMLGRLRMTVDDCIDKYPDMVKRIFGKPRHDFFGLRDKYNPKYLKKVIEEIVAEHTKSAAPHDGPTATKLVNYPSPGDLCKTVVIAKEILDQDQIERLYRFRTYDHYGIGQSPRQDNVNFGAADNERIWLIARATSAAPTYFPVVKIGSCKYSDGGAGYNNPAKQAYDEVKRHVGEHEEFPVPILISIGTGLKKEANSTNPDPTPMVTRKRDRFGKSINAVAHAPVKVVKKRAGLIRRWANEIAQTEGIHREMKNLMRDEEAKYRRFNPDERVGGLKLDEWDNNTMSSIQQCIKDYLADSKVQQDIEDYSGWLVALRRARIAQDPWQWTRFASCKSIRCHKCPEAVGSLSDMETHIRKRHMKPMENRSPEEIVALIERECAFEDPIVPGGPW